MGRECRICGGRDVTTITRGARAYLRCARCRSITMDLTEDAYRALDPSYDPGPLDALARPEVADAFLDVPHKVRLLERLLEGLEGPRARFLDVGCGMGAYLLAARRMGFEVLGVEPSEEHSRVAREVLGLDVRPGYFDPTELPEGHFDVVILSHVIEHIYAPGPFLEGLMRVVRPGGRVIVITPNADSTIARWTGAWWVMLEPVDHVSMLSRASFDWLGLDGVAIRVTTSEHPAEVPFALAGSLKQRLRAARAPGPRTEAAPASSARPARPGRRLWEVAKVQLTLGRRLVQKHGHNPVHLWNRLVDRQATLVATLDRPR